MYDRSALKNLHNWKNKEKRKPLILRGARQVGKTSLANIFAKEFDSYINLNLDKSRDLQIFKQDLDFKDLFKLIMLNAQQRNDGQKILIFIDEIQNSPAALAALRYFYEEAPSNIYIIAAGSLLEVMLAKKSFNIPVGRVEYLYIYPFSFTEFLEAKGQQELSKELNNIPINPAFHTLIQKLFYEYLQIGGMPEVLTAYLKK